MNQRNPKRLIGYIDESVSKNDRVFTLSALVGTSEDWAALIHDWEQMILGTNRFLESQDRRPISRYHASEGQARSNEFKGWTEEEQRALTSRMLQILRRRWLKTVAYSTDVIALSNVLPGIDLKAAAYATTTIFLVHELGSWLHEKGALNETRLALIHDRCDYDSVIEDSFRAMVDNPTFEYRSFFTSCTPLNSRNCIPLQAADLFAFENMKDAERRQDGDGRKMRFSYEKLLTEGGVGLRHRFIGAENIRNMMHLFATLKLPPRRGKTNS